MTPTYTHAELSALVDMPPRTVRYYVQIGLIDGPEGETRAARYGQEQLNQLLQIKKWTAAGLSLDRIRELLRGDVPPVAPRPRAIGSLHARSHVLVAEGVELVVDPQVANLSIEQLRTFARAVAQAYEVITEQPTLSSNTSPAQGGAKE